MSKKKVTRSKKCKLLGKHTHTNNLYSAKSNNISRAL